MNYTLLKIYLHPSWILGYVDFLSIRKKKNNGEEYQPDVLSTIYRALNRYLDVKNYGVNILNDELFKKSRDVLAAKRKVLKKMGIGGKPNATRELREEEVNILYEKGYFSMNNGESLQKGLWWLLSIHAGGRAVDEARQGSEYD